MKRGVINRLKTLVLYVFLLFVNEPEVHQQFSEAPMAKQQSELKLFDTGRERSDVKEDVNNYRSNTIFVIAFSPNGITLANC
jgi:hypothetical protein